MYPITFRSIFDFIDSCAHKPRPPIPHIPRKQPSMDPHFSLHTLSISTNGPHPLQPSILPGASPRLNFRDIKRILYLASADDEFCLRDSNAVRAKTARYTSQVNRHWRTIALNQPAIWLGPVLCWYSAPCWLDAVLNRSNPLLLDALIPSDAPLIAIQLALRHLSRIRDLVLDISSRDTWVEAEKALRQQQAPYLERFSIKIPPVVDRSRRSVFPPPKNLFCSYAPMLQQFKTHNFPVDLTLKIFHNLKVLVIYKMQFIPIPHLLDVLRNITGLQELEITRPTENVMSPTDFCAPLPIPDPLYMSDLRRLSISAPVSACADILRNLAIPESCDISLHCRNAYNGRDLRDISSRLGRILTHWRCEPYTGQQAVSIGALYINFAVEGLCEYSDRRHPSIHLKVSWPTQDALILDNFFSIFPLVASAFRHCGTVPDTLALFSEPDAFTAPNVSAVRLLQVLNDWLRELDHTQRVIFRNHDAFVLYGLLLGPSENGLDDICLGDLLLPELGDLVMEGVDFRLQQREQWKRLLQILRRRSKSGVPIQEIDFVRCVGDYSQSIPVRYGVDVKVDGVYQDSDSDDGGESDYTVQYQSD